MAGIIEQAQQNPGPEEGAAPTRKMTPAAAREAMPIPPDKLDTYSKIVAAGKKILFSEQMAPEINELLQGPGDMGEKLGMGAFALVSMLLAKSNGTLPADLLVPAGCELVVEAGNLLGDAGADVTDKDIAKGASVFVRQVMQKAGIDENQLAAGVQQEGAPAPAEAEEPDDEDDDEVAPDGKPTMKV